MSSFVFDFDGTIADTFSLAVQIFYQLTNQTKLLPQEEVDRLRGLTLMKVAEELRIPPWRVPLLIMKGRRLMAHNMATAQIIPGMDELIKRLHTDGHELFILSSNSSQNIRLFLKRYDLEGAFAHIQGGVSVFAKARALQRLMQQQKLNHLDLLYVGDEARDIEAAHRVKARAVAVTWGYNNVHILNKHEPYALVFDPAEIIGLERQARTNG